MPTVLVVDGERAEFGRLQVVCEEAAIAAAWAANVAEAVRYVHREVPAAILIDSSTPGGGIADIVSLLRQDPCTSRIPLVLLCDPSGTSLAEGWNSDADMVLEKPVDPIELLAVIRHLVAAPR